jgi:hypothetical protein
MDFYSPLETFQLLLVADVENIACLPAVEVFPLWYRSIDLSTDPGLKSHLIT